MKWRLDPGQIEVVDEDVAAVLRTKSAAEKFALTAEANRLARELMAADFRARRPEWTAKQVADEVRRTVLEDRVSDAVAERATDLAYALAGIPRRAGAVFTVGGESDPVAGSQPEARAREDAPPSEESPPSLALRAAIRPPQ